MKQYYSSFLISSILLLLSQSANAQWIRVWQAGESTRYAVTDITSIPYTLSGSTVTIGDVEYSTAEIDSITMVNPVTITWDGTTATVDIPENVEGVTAEISGGDVVINNTNVSTEQEFILQGSSSSGSLTYNGSYKAKFHLNGVSLTSTTGAALDIQCGKRIDVFLIDGTTNSLTDAANGTHKAAFNCQGHMEIAGGGTLNIAGNTNHAMRSKEYLFLKKSTGTINVTAAVADGIHCGEWFQMNGGSINISGQGADGLQMETAEESDETQNGQFIMNGGSINVKMTVADTKGIRADSTVAEMYLNGGTIYVEVGSTASDAKGIACDGNMTISEDSETMTVTVDVNGEGYKDSAGDKVRSTGIKCEYMMTMNGGTVTSNANGTYARAVRAGSLTANGGTLTGTTNGEKSQGIKLDGASNYVNNGGTVSPTPTF
ncbi:MAG: carbohydrate-binding domain-containing protein [Bacteroidaceae bacterium]|nr:carbohydrate-binding domain-containing protein [Bacteroidaceae bacterium]